MTVNINNIRKIGSLLFSDIGGVRLKPFISEPIGRGASGDKTYPIDKKAEDIIIEGLERLKEPLTIISEEYGEKEVNGGGKKIIIDPIDGSKNAITGIPFYCASIAVAEGDTIGTVSLAYIINLLTGDEFWAENGRGAFFNGDRIYTQKDDLFYLIAYESPNPSIDIPKIMPLLSSARRTRCFGATALDLSYLAYGSISVFVTPSPSRSFDFAGGWLLVKEAGGVFSDLEGNPADNVSLDIRRSIPLLAAGNTMLHEKALGLIAR
ncbi:MAG: hypothetical protein L0Y62_01795 [Nitrospirae bacterium]|nr:hypothetical protein [Nitrospirota bacterium]